MTNIRTSTSPLQMLQSSVAAGCTFQKVPALTRISNARVLSAHQRLFQRTSTAKGRVARMSALPVLTTPPRSGQGAQQEAWRSFPAWGARPARRGAVGEGSRGGGG